MTSCLLLGSNMGNREELLQMARESIAKECGEITTVSKVYETEPWGFETDTLFLNQAIVIETELSPEKLLSRCLKIETLLGRERPTDDPRYHSRTIDIDILFYESVVCRTPEITLPHARLHLRRFALEPLTEVAPEWKHPILGLTGGEILLSLRD
jgi:2-amino-4-hydroxy-6-hydroxymethyldihydropteridine diphosphokinase